MLKNTHPVTAKKGLSQRIEASVAILEGKVSPAFRCGD
jgi:hypothetical protein